MSVPPPWSTSGRPLDTGEYGSVAGTAPSLRPRKVREFPLYSRPRLGPRRDEMKYLEDTTGYAPFDIPATGLGSWENSIMTGSGPSQRDGDVVVIKDFSIRGVFAPPREFDPASSTVGEFEFVVIWMPENISFATAVPPSPLDMFVVTPPGVVLPGAFLNDGMHSSCEILGRFRRVFTGLNSVNDPQYQKGPWIINHRITVDRTSVWRQGDHLGLYANLASGVLLLYFLIKQDRDESVASMKYLARVSFTDALL